MRRRVALDARKMARRSVEGIGHYVHQLASRLPALAPDLEFLLLTDRPMSVDEVPSGCSQIVLGEALPEGGTLAKLYSPFWMNIVVADFLKRGRVDLFHATSYALPVSGQCRCVVTMHDIGFISVPRMFSFIHRKYLRLQVALGVRRAQCVITGSEAARNDLVRAVGADRDRTTVIYHGIDTRYTSCHDADYLARVRVRLRLPQRFILHVGAVETKKNLVSLLRAGGSLVREGLVDGIVLAGRDGRGADAVRRTAARLGVAEKTYFLGYVPLELMPGLYSLAQVLVYPSWYEGFGLPIVESMACGTPVIASDSSSMPEVAGGAAVLFPPDSSGAL